MIEGGFKIVSIMLLLLYCMGMQCALPHKTMLCLFNVILTFIATSCLKAPIHYFPKGGIKGPHLNSTENLKCCSLRRVKLRLGVLRFK